MDVLFLTGISAAFLTTVAFLPQVIKAHQTKHTKDLSFVMLVLLIFGLVLWTIYGIVLNQVPIILPNSITLMLCLYLMFLKVKYG